MAADMDPAIAARREPVAVRERRERVVLPAARALEARPACPAAAEVAQPVARVDLAEREEAPAGLQEQAGAAGDPVEVAVDPPVQRARAELPEPR